MRIKFSLGVKQNEPSFFFEGELKGFSDSVQITTILKMLFVYLNIVLRKIVIFL